MPTTITQLAKVTKLPPEELLEYVVEAGLPKREASSEITDEEQLQLIEYLRQRKKKPRAAPKKKAAAAPKKAKTATKTVTRKSKTATRTTKKKESAEDAPKSKSPKPKKSAAVPKAAEVDEPSDTPKSKSTKPKKSAVAPKPKSPKPKKSAAVPKATEADELTDTPPQGPASADASTAPQEDAQSEFTQLHIDSDKRTTRRPKKPPKPTRKVKIESDSKHKFEKPTKPVIREVSIPEQLTVADLAQRLAIKSGELSKKLVQMGVMATINQSLDQDTAILVVEELGHIAKPEKSKATEALVSKAEVQQGPQEPRSPVVTVMGHVDHGKTSLLDYIRKSQVADGEAGGITQHIGAYHVETEKGMITFIDTPGHESFTGMRSRGAQVTDIVVLVVAADDGVMPQTVEAIEHAKLAEVPIIVALNKIDKEGADSEKVKGDLTQHEIVPEEWGGDNIIVEVSAKQGQNIDKLLEAISLQAEMMELKASKEGNAVATVIESSRNKERGVAVTLLVRSGTLKKGDVLLAGAEFGKVRSLVDESGQQISSAGPSLPVVVFGMSGAPEVGDESVVVDSERKARSVATARQEELRTNRLAGLSTISEPFSAFGAEQKKEVCVLIRSDTHGTSEALRESIEKIEADEVKVKIITSQIGGITVSDVNLAAASKAIIIGFNVRADANARKAAENQGVAIRYYSVIYELIDDIKETMSSLLSPEVREEIVGIALVKDVFRSSKLGAVAGCQVIEGAVKHGNPIRVLRDSVVIFEGDLESLRRHKDDVKEVKAGTECGIAVKDYNDVKSGDEIEVFQKIEVQRNL